MGPLRGRLPRRDIAGGLTITAGLALLVYALVETESNGWLSATTLALIAGSGVLVALFIAIEARVEHPLVRLGFFRDRAVSYANAAGLLFGASVRTGPGPVLIAALTAGTLGMLALAQASVNGTYVSDVLGPFVLLGLGLGPVITALSAAATDRVSEQEAGLASGLINTTQSLGGAIGLAVLVSLATSRAKAAAASVGGPPSEQPAALVEGFQLAFYLGGAISAAAIAFAALGVWVGRRASG